jgi:arginyl-tRNA synthetase
VFQQIENAVAEAFAAAIAVRFGIDKEVTVEQPKQSGFGELAVPAAFQLARELKQPPRKIAEQIVEALEPIPGVKSFEIAGNGYVNIRLDRGAFAAAVLHKTGALDAADTGKIIVEHTNINPNKAAHIGHLRNAVLGDTFVRMLRAGGRHVEVQNYIDNTGVQVADVVVGFHFLEKKTPAHIRDLIHTTRFDYLCWDLYARTSQYYKDEPDALAWRAETLQAIEADSGDLAEMAHLVADAIVALHLKTMLRLNVEYDVLPRESEILHLKFWSSAFERLKSTGAILLETEGKNAGCWVMPASAFSTDTEAEDGKVIVRSNGTVTYVGKDIAYQMWKFGLLGKDFYYRPLLTYPDGHEVWVSTDRKLDIAAPEFGAAKRVYNVIDSRQSYLQDVVVAGLKAMGAQKEAAQSIHFSYEMVALSPGCCVDLGIELSEEDRRRPYVEVSGRKGMGVKADDLIDQLIQTALREVESRHAEDAPGIRLRIATEIAIGALRYFLLKFTRNTVIAFDFQEALSFEGDTGPYAQYAAVRARNILKKLTDRGEAVPDFARELSADGLAEQMQSEDFWQILVTASKADSTIARAVAAGEPAHVARYAFQLAQLFNNFYHQYQVLAEQDTKRRVFLLWMTDYFRTQLETVLGVLGIHVPEYM